MVTPHLPWKFHANRSSRFLIMLLKRNKEIAQKQYPIPTGNRVTSDWATDCYTNCIVLFQPFTVSLINISYIIWSVVLTWHSMCNTQSAHQTGWMNDMSMYRTFTLNVQWTNITHTPINVTSLHQLWCTVTLHLLVLTFISFNNWTFTQQFPSKCFITILHVHWLTVTKLPVWRTTWQKDTVHVTEYN